MTCDRFEKVLVLNSAEAARQQTTPAPLISEDRGPLYRSEDIQPDEFIIAKSDEDKRLVFGWANVAKMADGSVVIDAHGDYIEPEDLESAAYEHVLKFRATGEAHRGDVKGQMVESFMVTDEKLEAIGLAKDALPRGWWVGYRVDDDALWADVKAGRYRSFSIQGVAEVE